MKGAIIGDIIGSVYIDKPIDADHFQFIKPSSAYTDDTILTLSTADAILNGKSFSETLREWVRTCPMAGYREEFLNWVLSNEKDVYISRGNGAARRISPIGFAAETLEEAMSLAEETTSITHNIPLKIKASKAVAGAIYLAKNDGIKKEIKQFVEDIFDFKLLDDISEYSPSAVEESPVPAAVTAFLKSGSYEDAIKNAIMIGGPTNTLASITGGIAQAYYKHIPKSIIRKSLERLTPEMKKLIVEFEKKYFPQQKSSADFILNMR
jgi:ADP-ribosylglycohydrolase